MSRVIFDARTLIIVVDVPAQTWMDQRIYDSMEIRRPSIHYAREALGWDALKTASRSLLSGMEDGNQRTPRANR